MNNALNFLSSLALSVIVAFFPPGGRGFLCIKSFYRPQTKFAKVMFLQVSVCPQGGRARLLPGGMHGCSRGVCMVARGRMHSCSWGGVWLLQGGMHGCSGGACVVALGGVHGCSGGGVVARGMCVFALGGCVWLLLGGMHGCSRGGMCGCSWGACVVAQGGTMRYRDMINEQAVCILLECILFQGGHSTGKTGNLVLTFSRHGKHWGIWFGHREKFANTGKIFGL